MVSNLEKLIPFGTEHLEPEERAGALREEYYRLLATVWPHRGKGLPHDTVLGLVVILFFPLLFGGGFLLVYLLEGGRVGAEGMSLSTYFFLISYILVLCGIFLAFLSRININKRTMRNTFQKYPAVKNAAKRLIDHTKGEALRDYLPILKIEERTIFYLAFLNRQKRTLKPSGILILDDQGQAILEERTFERATLTAFVSITCGHAIQQNAETARRSMNNVINKLIPKARKIISSQENNFRERGLHAKWILIMDGADMLPKSLQESLTILEGEAAFRKAMGYAFALEFHYEDALELRNLYLAYVRYLNSAYRRKIIDLSSNAAMLIQTIKEDNSFPDRKNVMQALATLAVAGPNGVLSWIWQREYEGTVEDGERKAYNEKTIWAKNLGWKVIDS